MSAIIRQLKEAEELVRRAENTHRLTDRFHWLKCAASLYNAAGSKTLAEIAETKAEEARKLLERSIYRD